MTTNILTLPGHSWKMLFDPLLSCGNVNNMKLHKQSQCELTLYVMICAQIDIQGLHFWRYFWNRKRSIIVRMKIKRERWWVGCVFWYWVNKLFEQRQFDSMRYRIWRYLRELEDINLLDDWYVSKARHTCCLVSNSSSCARNSFATASCPFSSANDNGVWPFESLESVSTSSRASNSFTTASCPLKAAHDNGVRPLESLESLLTSSRARNSFTTASCPFSATNDNGVWPFESLESVSTSSRARNSF